MVFLKHVWYLFLSQYIKQEEITEESPKVEELALG